MREGGGGGSCPNPNFLRNFSACVWIFFFFFRVGGGFLIPKLSRNFFFLEFGHFSGRRGGLPFSKDNEVLFLLCVRG